MLEPAIAIVAICLAQLRPLVQQIIPASWFATPKASVGNVTTIGRKGGPNRHADSQLLMTTVDQDFEKKATYPGSTSISSSQGDKCHGRTDLSDLERCESSHQPGQRVDDGSKL